MKGTMMNTEKGIILSKSLVALVNCFFSRRVKMFPFRSLMISLEPVTSSLPNNLVLIHTCFKPFFVDFQALALLALAYSHHCQMRRKYNVGMGQELSSQDKTVFRGSLRKNKKKSNWESYPSFGEVQRGLGGWSNQLVSLLVSLQNEDIWLWIIRVS